MTAVAPDGTVVPLGEIAHIVGESPGGPRGNSPLSASERNEYANLIFLCAKHHQLVDSVPQTYPVERLHAMKEDHERWVEKAVDPTTPRGDGRGAAAWTSEALFATLLPVTEAPKTIFSAPTSATKESGVQVNFKAMKPEWVAPFVIRGSRLYAFQNLERKKSPFSHLIDQRKVEEHNLSGWLTDPNHAAWHMDLLNRLLNKLTGRRGLNLDREHKRYYFAPDEPGKPKEITYTSLNRTGVSRSVVWQPVTKATGKPKSYWIHCAVAARFLRPSTNSLCLALRPEFRITTDGSAPYPSSGVGAKITKAKSKMFNHDMLAELQFWRDYLGGGEPRIVLPFEAGRRLVISTDLVTVNVSWPGIPSEYAQAFRNVHFEETLFSWAKLHGGSALEEGEELEDGDVEEDESEDDEVEVDE